MHESSDGQSDNASAFGGLFCVQAVVPGMEDYSMICMNISSSQPRKGHDEGGVKGEREERSRWLGSESRNLTVRLKYQASQHKTSQT